MKYFDRSGKEILQDEWNCLLRKREYVLVEHNVYGPSSVTTQWIGIQTVYCASATIFCTRLSTQEGECWFWHDSTVTLGMAIAFHFELCKKNHVIFRRRRK